MAVLVAVGTAVIVIGHRRLSSQPCPEALKDARHRRRILHRPGDNAGSFEPDPGREANYDVIGSEDLHDLAAAYALDALDDIERQSFEEHLADCAVCAEEIHSLRSAAGALAYAVEGPAPPAALRDRLLERARAERPPEVATIRRRRYALPVAAAVAAVAACAAIAFGVWASTLQSDLDSATATQAEISRVLSDQDSRSLALAGRGGQLVVSPTGKAVLVASGLPRAPAGKTYEAWVVGEAPEPLPAGIFPGGQQAVLLLERRVPEGTKVAVSLEPAGGVQKVSGPILFGTQETV
jgi:anti-sigma-K factor RskA